MYREIVLCVLAVVPLAGCRTIDPVFNALDIYAYELSVLGDGEFEVVRKNGDSERILHVIPNEKANVMLYLQAASCGRVSVYLYDPKRDEDRAAVVVVENPIRNKGVIAGDLVGPFSSHTLMWESEHLDNCILLRKKHSSKPALSPPKE